MIKRAAYTLALTTGLSSPAFGQGVPEVDVSAIAQWQILLGEAQLQTSQLEASNEELEAQIGSRQDQIAALQQTIDMLRNRTGMISDLEDWEGMVATEIYSIDDNNPYAPRLFGDARETIEMMIAETAVQYGNHPNLAAAGINAVEFRAWFQALIKQESAFSIGARSEANAFGLTQIIPGTAEYLGIYPEYYDDPRLQLDGGARYLIEQVGTFGSMPLALAAYNAGPGAVQQYNGIPPYRETQDYVVKVTGYYNDYAAQLVGADQVGTLSLEDMTIAELSNISDAAMSYGMHSQQILVQSLTRLQNILSRIPASASAQEAMDLNSYAKAEVVRIAAVLTRLLAAKRRAEWAQYGTIFAAYARDTLYFEGLTE